MTKKRIPKKREQQQIRVPEVIQIQTMLADRRLTMWSPIEVRAVIRYKRAREIDVYVIHERLQTVCDEEVMSRQMIGRWCCIQ